MTGQIADTIRFADLVYSIGGIRSSKVNGEHQAGEPDKNQNRQRPWEELFDPSQHGLEPVGRITACRRGYINHYGVTNDRLCLDSLSIFLKDVPTSFLGALLSDSKGFPYPDAVWHAYTAVGPEASLAEYYELDHQITFTGELLAGRDFINKLYIHMGFQPAWKFREVLHFTFDTGRLTDCRDRSREAGEFRRQLGHRGSPSPESFSLRFDIMDPWVD